MVAELLATWWAWIVTATLQASALLGAVWLADRLLRRVAWSQVLACLWWLALARLVLPMEISSPWSVMTEVGAKAAAAARATPPGAALLGLFSLWALGTVFVIVARMRRRRRLLRSIEHVALPRAWSAALERARSIAGVSRTPRLGALSGLRGAAVCGAMRPTLLFPPSALDRAPAAADKHALLHELMHVRRGDLWKDELVALARALFWFNPLVWQAASRIHQLSELACDRAVANALGADATDYRNTLLAAAREWIAPRAAPPTELRAFLGPRAMILARLEQLEKRVGPSLFAVRAVSAALAALLTACVLPMAPSAPSLREQALSVLAAERHGELQSCFSLQAAALVLAADSHHDRQAP